MPPWDSLGVTARQGFRVPARSLLAARCTAPQDTPTKLHMKRTSPYDKTSPSTASWCVAGFVVHRTSAYVKRAHYYELIVLSSVSETRSMRV